MPGGGGSAVVALPAAAAVVAPPPDLPAEVHALWADVVADMSRAKAADLEVAAMLCMSAYVHQQARASIAADGILVVGSGGNLVANPAVKMARDEAATFQRLAAEYGLTLAARLRLGLMQLAGESLMASLNADLDAPTITVGV